MKVQVMRQPAPPGVVYPDESAGQFPGRLEFITQCERHYLQTVIDRNATAPEMARECKCQRQAFYLLLRSTGLKLPPEKSGKVGRPPKPGAIPKPQQTLSTPQQLLQGWLTRPKHTRSPE